MDYLHRVLTALRFQTHSLKDWELVLVDNHPDIPLADRLDLSWHPAARIVVEERLGLTAARLRGITESTAPLLVFVDDDNVLAPDYLATTLVLATKHAMLGAWSGQVLLKCEGSPPQALQPFLHLLCLRPLTCEIWGNLANSGLLPYGAGMCVRREIAERYVRDLGTNPARMALDRTGDVLYCSGDLDMGMTAVAMGFGTGLFPVLNVTHLIPQRRLDEAYLLRLMRDGLASYVVFNHIWSLDPALPRSRVDRFVRAYKRWRATALQKKFTAAMREGEILGQRLVAELSSLPPVLRQAE